jgi:hypothetical protein
MTMLTQTRNRWIWLAGFVLALLSIDFAVPSLVQAEWQAHEIRQGDGQGGLVARPAQRQVLKHPDSEHTMPFGLTQMDNGEIAIIVSREKANPAGGRIFEPNIAFSQDGGATWSPFQAIPGTKGRPQFLTWLGGGSLSFVTEALGGGRQQRFFSNDYGRTWKESIDHPGTRDGKGFGLEGNGWVDRDEKGAPKAILEIGYHLDAGKSHPTGDFTGVFRRSVDGGKTWIDEVSPPQWKFTVEHNGKKWLRGVSEGAVVRAANGDLVAALRTDMPPKYFEGPHDDSLEGTAISISKDNGKTWSDLKFLFEAGRHHANLQRMPNGDLVCTLVVRDDIQAGKLNKGELTSHRRGCDSLVSHDHGQTWNLDRRYELDSFEFLRPDGYWVDGVCGHIGAVALNDGHMLAVYGNYRVGAVLIKWQPGEVEKQASLYVSPAGSDEHAGTIDAPFLTLERARDAIRALKAESPDKPITVLIRGGTHRLEQSVVFSGRDSGSADAPITYKAYPGETPVFSGGRVVTGWKPYRDKILAAQLPQIENQYYRFRELFLNGQRQIRARYPNRDPQDPRFGGWAFIEGTLPAGDAAPIRFMGEKGVFPRQWAKPDQGEIFIIPGLAWNSHLIPIRDYNPQTGEITVSRRPNQVWDRLMKGNRFYVENLLEELDQPGEWCFDAATLTLYFWPPQGTLDGAEVTIPVIDRLIELRATTHEPVRHLHFSGLTFTQTLPVFPWIHPLNPDYLECNRPNSGGFAFYLENSADCVIDRCRFDQVGGDAIRVHGASTRNRITRNEIVGAGAQGICFADLEFWPYHYPAVWRGNEAKLQSVSSRLPWAVGNVIENNHIHDCGVIDNFGAAIHFHALNTDGNVVAHNHIHDQPHHGIYFSMGFGQNFIEYNDIHDLCFVMADAGGVYCNRWGILPDDPVLSKGQIVRYNRIRGVMGVLPHAAPSDDPANTPSGNRIHRPHMTWGIYFDNSPRRAEVYGNLCIDNTWGGVFIGGGYAEPQDCVVENNIFVNSSIYQFDAVVGERASGNKFRRNIISYSRPEAALMRAGKAWKDGSASYRGWQEFDSNVYFQSGGAPLRIADLPGESITDWKKLGFDQNSLVSDPLFVDPAQGDYRLKPDSPAGKLGFQPLPFEKIGIQKH